MLPQPCRSAENLRPLERISQGGDGKGVISKIYSFLIEAECLEMPPYIKKWEEELGSSLSTTELKQIWKRVHTSSANSKLVELNYKCLMRWYITPDKAHKFKKEASELCWRGCRQIGNMAHIWWQCPRIKGYWRRVRQIITEVTDIEIPDDPWGCLHQRVRLPMKQYQKSLLPHLLIAAKSLIAIHWQDRESPSIKEWCNKMNSIQNLEFLRLSDKDGSEEYEKIWSKWTEFKHSMTFAELMGA